MATPFKAYANFTNGNTGKRFNINLSADDVSGNYVTDPSGSEFVQLPNDGIYILSDLVLSAAGADTDTLSVEVNGRTTPEVILDSANKGDVYDRQVKSMKLAFQPGSKVAFKQA